MVNPAVRNENIKKLRELIADIPVAMLTTVDDETGRLHSRPMLTQRTEFDGTLWFFTKISDTQVGNVAEKPDVAVTYVESTRNLFIAVQGKATTMRDLALMEEQWHGGLAAWFPQGLDDPELGIIKIDVEKAEYWDGPGNAMQRVVDLVRSFTSGEAQQAGDNEELSIS